MEFYGQSFVWSPHEVSNLANYLAGHTQNSEPQQTLIFISDVFHSATLSRGLMVAKVLSCGARGLPRLFVNALMKPSSPRARDK